MKNEIQINDELIARYLSGEASPEEAMALDDWLQEAGNRAHFAALQKTWYATFPAKSPRALQVGKAWADVSHRKNEIAEAPVPRVVHFYQTTIFKVAASIVFVVAFGLVFYLNSNKDSIANDITVVATDSIQQVGFSDHSKATLNRNTSLTYPNAFEKEERKIQMTSGEAFFDIAPDATRPFIVNTDIATIQVLGTAFNVILKSDTLEVSVDHGKVLVYTESDSVYLEAGKAAVLPRHAEIFDLGESNKNVWAYATHKFVFTNTPLREVFSFVEKAQNCTIQTGNVDIGNCKLTATFESVSTDYMLTLITEALNLSVTKNDDRTFTVEGQGCR